jgi:peptidoglycan/LPS O-acetylase OafA/YrhL
MQGISLKMETSQIRELTSLRGLASLVVLFGHIFIVINRHAVNNSSQHDVFVNKVFDFLGEAFNGPAAVEIFFVLSGLVLSLSLDKRAHHKNDQWIISFYTKRLFRIYPALWISLLLSLLLLNLDRQACSNNICTSWGSGVYQEDYTLNRTILSFMGIYVHLNGPMWSLRVELFYSLLFPGIYIALRKGKIFAIVFSLVIVTASLLTPRFYSVHYVLAFALGSAIPLVSARGNKTFNQVCVTLALITLIFSRMAFSSYGWEIKTFEIIEMLSAFVVIYAIYYEIAPTSVLRKGVLFHLGEISYSIYILHFPLLFALLYALNKMADRQQLLASPNLYTLLLGAMTFTVTIILSAMNFKYIEKPFQKLGGQIAKKWNDSQDKQNQHSLA